MSAKTNLLAFDFGAESGRVVLGQYDGGLLSVIEVHRFPNEPVKYNGELHWDLPRLWLETQRGLEAASLRAGSSFEAVGIDTWGLDYALLGEGGSLLENPYHYRDSRTDGVMAEVFERVPPADIYSTTGVQFMQINTLYQVYAHSRRDPELLRSARQLITVPDLLNYWLTGKITCEYTNATTTQFFDAVRRDWARDLLDRLDVPSHFLVPVIEPASQVGCLLPEIARATNVVPCPVIAPACHDTGSAVAAITMSPNTAYISSGTWSLLGTELMEPCITPLSLRMNFTNEGGVSGTVRLLKNITGMWLLQCCRREWSAGGREYTYADLIQEAGRTTDLGSIIDPDDPSFLRPSGMLDAIASYCARTGQSAPARPEAITRTILESLALKYRYVLDELEAVTGRQFTEVRIVGGGARNHVLNQLTADATARTVLAGPIEATALGNLAVQMLAVGAVANLAEARKIIDRSFPTEKFVPRDPGRWDGAYARLREYCAVSMPVH